MAVTGRNILVSIDLEEFEILSEFGGHALEEEFAVSRQGLEALLEVFRQLEIPVTFFATVRFLASQPGLGRSLVGLGHEIASHGYCHRHFVQEDLARSRQDLEQLAGEPVYGYRSARFQPVCPEALRAAGYRYDSSIHPILLPGRYNYLRFPRVPFRYGGLPELPVSVSPGLRYPFFWLAFKNAPFWFHWELSRYTLRKDGYLLLVFHPWEFAPLERFRMLPVYVRSPSGHALVSRLAEYLGKLKREGWFVTCWEFCQKRFG
ncbi:Polysaccharide deacetylase [Candidatus Methylacidithermus pantelleriae]|uniref:Polysaccharide deacetylase n=2 Tax=Candidatus Methylacidithermus pantelleriae TaxID=2744239 RepID=A0A8J2BU91_9BACT|nr:Polysaccharide deacetylase [Candidatus Methylacidithermus pantelleriae]